MNSDCLDSLSPTASSAQVGDEVFLKGKYIELGIHSVGSFGTRHVCRMRW